MNINIELKNHLLYEFTINNYGFLNETRSIVNGIDNTVLMFLNMVSEQIKNTKTKSTNIYTEKNNFNIKTFFTQFKLKLTITKGEKKYSGGCDINNSIIKNSENKWICIPDIELQVQGKNENEIRNVFGFAIGHELTHLYNMLQYAIKNNENGYNNVFDKNKYRNISNTMSNPFFEKNTKIIAQILYTLTRIERNAYIAQLRQELLNQEELITDTNSAYEAIKNTESYKRLLFLEKNINILFSEDLNNSETTKTNILSTLNKTMNKKFTNFEQVKKYFLRRWLKWKKAYLSRASKIAYDVFLKKYKNNWTINNSSNHLTLEV